MGPVRGAAVPASSMSTLAIILIVVAGAIVVPLVGGMLAARRRSSLDSDAYAAHLTAADQALEEARALDRGWEKSVLDEAARAALAETHPGTSFDEVHLVLVEDRPGISEDRAHFLARASDRTARVVLVRDESGWSAES